MTRPARSILSYATGSAICAVALACDNAATEPRIGPPAAVLVVGGQEQKGTVGRELPEQIAAKIVDMQNRPVAGYPVTFLVTSGNGTVSPDHAVTSTDGSVTARWTLGSSSPGGQQVEARVLDTLTHQQLASAEYRATAAADAPVSLEKTAGDGQTGTSGSAVAVVPSVKVVDQYGNPVSQTTVSWQASAGGTVGGAGTATSTTSDAGVAVAPGAWVLDQKVGPNTLTATVVGIPPVTFSASGTTGPPASLEFVVAPSTVATNGEHLSSQPVVQLTDQYGNPVAVADAVVQITQISGSGAGALTIWNDTTRTNAQGIATFTGTTINGPVGDGYRLGFATPTTTTLASNPINLLRGRPYALALRIPADGASRGSAFTVQPLVQAVDAGGNPAVVAECVNASIGFGVGATLTGGTQISAIGDTFAFQTLGISPTSNPGTYTITYSTGCCAPNASLLPVSQQVQVP